MSTPIFQLKASLPTQTPISEAQKIEITNYINNYRKIHQAPPLVWDETIATFSQNWSNFLTSNNEFKHSGTSLYGENLAYFKGYNTSDLMYLLKLSVDLWYNEISLYNFNNPGFSEATGHFTLMVWKSSLKFGMGISIIDNVAIISFNSSPPGNYINPGQFQTNVLPPIGQIPAPVPTPIPAPTPTPIPDPASVPSSIPNIINSLYLVISEVNTTNPNKKLITSQLKKIIVNLAEL